MKRYTVKGPRRFRGELEPPGDKSITHRAFLLGALAKGETTVTRPLLGLDCRATAAAVEAFGVKIKRTPKAWKVAGAASVGASPLAEPERVIDCGNSGTSIRLLAGFAASLPFTTFFTGDESIRRRPMDRVLRPLQAMGASVLGAKGDTRAPFGIRGAPLRAVAHQLPVASSQVKSAILLAALRAEGITSIAEPGESRDHTERMLLHFGAALTRRPGYVSIKGGGALDAQEVFVPGDPSSAAFFLVGALGCPKSQLRLAAVGVNPTRLGLVQALRRMGAKVAIEGEREASGEPIGDLVVSTATSLSATEIPSAEIPALVDEVPVLALAATRAAGTTRIVGASELRVKESDRLAGTARLLRAFGAKVEESGEGLAIEGGGELRGARVSSGGDHRLAMTAAIAGCFASGETVIEDVACVETSYPGFFEDLEKVTEAL